MINYKSFTNILILLLFYLKASFRGLLQHSLLRYKINRYIIAILAFVSYAIYFHMNVVEFAKLEQVGQYYTFEELKMVISLSVVSYNNLAIMAGIFIFLLLNGIFILQKSSLFLAKTLPFEEKEVYWSVKLFKLGLALLFFELFFVILIPGLGVLQSSTIAVAFLLSCHTLFLVTYLLADLIYKFSFKYSPFTEKVTSRIVSATYFIGGLTYAFLIRFKIEFFLGRLFDNPTQLSVLILMISLCLLFGLLLVDKVWYDLVFLEQRFTGLLSAVSLRKLYQAILFAVVRTKLFLYSFIFLLFVIFYSWVVAGCDVAGNNLIDLWPLLSVSFIHYADSTLQHRKLYSHLGLGHLEEVRYLFYSFLMIQVPTLVLSLYLQVGLTSFLQALFIALISLVIGFLFPRSSSHLNESIALLLLLLAMIMLYLLSQLPLLLVPLIVVLTLGLISLIKKETEIK